MLTRGRGMALVVPIVFSVASTVWGLWFTWVVAFGGQLPPPFVDHVIDPGSLLLGVIAFFIGIPLIDTLFYWAGILVTLALALPFSGRRTALSQRPQRASTHGTAAPHPTGGSVDVDDPKPRQYDVSAWAKTGTPVLDPETLVVGKTYIVMGCMAFYRGRFHCGLYQGARPTLGLGGVDDWFAFEPSICDRALAGVAGLRLNHKQFTSEYSLNPAVIAPPVSDDDAQSAFDEERAAHQSNESPGDPMVTRTGRIHGVHDVGIVQKMPGADRWFAMCRTCGAPSVMSESQSQALANVNCEQFASEHPDLVTAPLA